MVIVKHARWLIMVGIAEIYHWPYSPKESHLQIKKGSYIAQKIFLAANNGEYTKRLSMRFSNSTENTRRLRRN